MSARSIRRSHERRIRRRRIAAATGAAIGGSALLASGASATNFPVSNLNDAGAGSLRGAVLAANANAGPDTISFNGTGASGEITLTTGEISITDDLAINGPGAAALSVSGDANNNNVRDFATSNVALGDSRVFAITDPTAPGTPTQAVSISGLTLKEGVGDFFSGGTPQARNGGAIYAGQTALTLTNVVVTDSVSTSSGGGVFLTNDGPSNEAGRLTVTGSQFTDNRALSGGGAIYSLPFKYVPGDDFSGTTITNSQITGNRAGGMDFGPFGYSPSPRAGGVQAKYGDVDIRGTTISGNVASTTGPSYTGGSAGGAAINSSGTVADSVISDNTAGASAGGIRMQGAKLRSSTVSGNAVTAGDGGGVVASGSKYGVSSKIEGSTISGNTASGAAPYDGRGGGVAAASFEGGGEQVVVRNSTIAANTAPRGSGVFFYTDVESEDPSVRLQGTIVADNGPGGDLLSQEATPAAPVSIPAGFSAGFSLIERPGSVTPFGDPSGSNLIGVDPQLAPLAANGGTTQTHALAPTSPAVDAAQAGPAVTDQRGQPRTVDAAATNATLSDGTDIGAFELTDPAATGDDPETAFKKKPKKKLKLKAGKKTAKLKLKLVGTDNAAPPGPLTFECKVDKGDFDDCKSPLKLSLAKGKHKIQVRAIDADGNVDATPVTAKVKVKAAKKK